MKTIVILAVSLSLALATQSAFAHAFLARAEPAVGSTIATSPIEIRLTFTEPVEGAFSTVGLATTSGTDIGLGPIRTDPKDGAVLIAPLTAPLPAGIYKVSWQVVSVDTHKTQGDFTFMLKP